MEVPLPPKKNNVEMDQALIVTGKQHCFGGEGEMSTIHNKKWKNSLSVPIRLPLIVVSDIPLTVKTNTLTVTYC